MTAQPVEANVVLTSDNSQYDRAMTTSAGNTDSLGMSVDNLGRKINNLSKTAGKTLIGISAADVALITGATAAWSSYEKQMTRLQAQSAILTRTNQQQSNVMKDYTAAVKGLRTEYGTTTTEAAKLVETLSKVTNMRQTRDLQDLSKVFVEMSHATGESSEGLASSLTNLQRVMGTPINAKNTRQYADQFTYLAAQTNTSAQGLIDFTAQLAPAGRQIHITSNQMAGFATAFAKAGQDSGPAANVFTKITTDIAHSMQTGSPEIAHYANMLGVTQKAFREMKGGEQVLQIFEALQTNSKGAAAELSRLGLDGPRSIRAIQAVLQQGGLRESMGLATQGGGATKEGADAARTMSQDISKLNEQFKQLGETMGGYFGPVVQKFVQGMTQALEVVNKIAEGPMGRFLALVMEFVAPVAAGAGALLLFAGALMKVAAAFTIFRSSAAYGAREGLRGGGALGSGAAGPRGERLEQAGTWFQRAQYTAGQAGGSLVASAGGLGRSGWQRGRGMLDPNYTPGPPRSPMSYIAGGLGRGMDLFLTPQFDQMRYADPTDRERSRYFKRTQMGQSAGVREAAAVADESRERARTAGAVYQSAQAAYGAGDPQAEQARRAMHRANQEALAATRASVAAQNEQISTTRNLNKETTNTTTGFRRLAQSTAGFAGGAVGGTLGAGRAGLGMLARSPIAGNLAFGLGAAGLGAAGVDSNMLMYGAMGGMIGGLPGAAIGAGVGAGFDMAQANNKMTDSISAFQDSATQASKTGIGLAGLADSSDQTKSAMDDQIHDIQNAKPWDIVAHPKSYFGNVKNSIEGIFGTSDVDEARNKYKTAQSLADSTESAARDLAKRTGTKIEGSPTQQREALEDFMGSIGQQRLKAAGIDFSDLVAAQAGGGKGYNQLLQQITMPKTQLQEVAGTAAGQALVDSPAARRSLQYQQDVGAFYEGTGQMFDKLRKRGMTDQQIMRTAERAQAQSGDENSRQYELFVALSGRAQQNMAMQMPLMGRAQAFQTQVGQLSNLEAAGPPRTQEAAAQLEQQKQATAQAFVDQASYFKQMILMQDQYEIQRSRGQQDYSLQRSYQEQDYQLSRSRAEYSFHLSQTRATADYYRGVRRAQYDFNLQRERAEDDYQHSIQVQAKQMAMSVYDIYNRVQVQRTSSASQLLSNAADQLQRMRQQERDLDRLRAMGGSDAMIQQMKFTDPANQQQLARFMSEVTPRVVRQFNQVAGSLRTNAAQQLMNDPSSLDADERRRAHRIQLQRSREDFQRQMELGHDDFTRALARQRKDFNLMMDQQAHDFDTQMGRQADAYQLSMQRSAEDLANVGKEIDGNFESILVQATKRLTGHAKEQAQAVLKSFQDLKGSSSKEAIATMQDLAEIFGFKYKIPKGVSNNVTPPDTRGTDNPNLHGPGGHVVGGMNQGGVVPGWSPGRDTRMVPLSGGEAIMRPEWARAMGEGYINAANHSAKHGGFADGGLVNPDARVYMDGEPVSKITKAQILLAEHLSHIDFRTMQGSWQPYTSYSGSSHMGPGVVDESPGNFQTQYWLRRVGFAAWGRNFPGAATAGSGAHVHAVSLLDPGAAHQGQVAAYYAGQDGLGGRDYGPDPGMVPGLRGMLAQFAALASVRDAHEAGAAATPRLASILKHRYPHSEAAAAAMSGVHPLFPGDISHVMNKLLRKRYAESLEGIDPNKHHSWYGQGGVFTGPQGIGVAEAGPEAVIPLNDAGAAFLATALHGAEARGIGMGASPMRGGMSVYNTRIDRSTNFTGPITVQANDPNELLSKLQARQRVMALSRPSLTGSAA